MVKRICLLIGIILLTGCDTKLRYLMMTKTPYFGDELRIDGYYHSTPDPYDGQIGIAIFYRDGFCMHPWGKLTNQDTLGYIEKEILLNNAYIAKLRSDPNHIGVFRIMHPDIQFEVWQFRNETVSRFGKIVNDTTFIISKSVSNRTGQTYPENLTYRFQQFSQKPDSTNSFVK